MLNRRRDHRVNHPRASLRGVPKALVVAWIAAAATLGCQGAFRGLPTRAQSQTQDRQGEGETPVVSGTQKGHAHVTWIFGNEQYAACLQTEGARGVATVTMPSRGYTISEDLTLFRDASGTYWVGSNPRHLDTGIPDPSYAPDTFAMVQNVDGTFSLTLTCDAQGVCAELAMHDPEGSEPYGEPPRAVGLQTTPLVPSAQFEGPLEEPGLADPLQSAGATANRERENCYTQCDLAELECGKTCRLFSDELSLCSSDCKADRRACDARCRS